MLLHADKARLAALEQFEFFAQDHGDNPQ